jgi:hypothetical protein
MCVVFAKQTNVTPRRMQTGIQYGSDAPTVKKAIAKFINDEITNNKTTINKKDKTTRDAHVIVLVVSNSNNKYIAIYVTTNTIYCNTRCHHYNKLILLK